MFLTEQEILDTPQALCRTYSYFTQQAQPLQQFFSAHTQRRFVFFGCGSSHMLAKSAAALFSSLPDTAAFAVPAGDYIVNPAFWQETVRGSIVVALSRSGRTSEMVRAVQHIKATLDCPVISISAQDGNDIMPLSNLDLTLDWCYDKSVCQTRTVSNLYAASLLLAAAYAKDEKLKVAVQVACQQCNDFQSTTRPALERLAQQEWDNVVVLADAAVCGIAEEGALAFTEVAMLTGRYFHLLDYRHGPIVISDQHTLTLMLLQPGETDLQGTLVKELIARGGPILTVSDQPSNPYSATEHLCIKGVDDFAAWGILFIYLAQMIALLKAIKQGGNPDAPKGLDAYIKL